MVRSASCCCSGAQRGLVQVNRWEEKPPWAGWDLEGISKIKVDVEYAKPLYGVFCEGERVVGGEVRVVSSIYAEKAGRLRGTLMSLDYESREAGAGHVHADPTRPGAHVGAVASAGTCVLVAPVLAAW